MPTETETAQQQLPQNAVLARSSAVQLATALCMYRAEALGVRVLMLKGPGAHYLRLRSEKNSADVDVLVEPGALPRLRRDLESIGWQSRFVPGSPRVVEAHAETLFHPNWPIDLDLHAFWPGFLADHTEAFETMWQQRVDFDIAENTVALPDRAASALVIALHQLRQPRKSGGHTALRDLRDACVALMGDEAFTILVDRSVQLGCTETARPFLELLGHDIPASPPAQRDELRKWRVNSGAKGYTEAWLYELMVVPWRSRPGVALRALFPSEDEMRALHPGIAPGRRAVASARIRRLANGMSELPRAVASVLRAKRY